jgi:hypothetical protein
MLQQVWHRRVIVPSELRGRTIRKRILRGTPEQVVTALALRLGPNTAKRKTRYPKGDYVRLGSELRYLARRCSPDCTLIDWGRRVSAENVPLFVDKGWTKAALKARPRPR